MSFSKIDLETIKLKIRLSTEIEKKTKIIKKGKDSWCCCPFHEEKTPSCKINDDLGTYYCFGCGAKGDIFTIYTDLYNFSFMDAVKELAQRTGIKISNEYSKNKYEYENIFKILECSTNWFESNLKINQNCKSYLKKRSISEKTTKIFRIGYSYNSKTSLYNFLKDNSFKDEDILKSNLVKIDKNNKFRDFFYKRLIFPISNEQNKIVGFGGRVLDNSNPKYINSPESYFFQKRNILYNLNNAKQTIRLKKNILICEGYMDVISLYEKNIKTAVAPLGTALTENQLLLSWKYVNKPTVMFDGDNSGIRAAYKSAIMALPYLSPNKFLQFINLPYNLDPDSFVNKYSLSKFVELLKKPVSIIDFIFEQSSSSVNLKNTDEKVSFDKYIDDIVETIKDKKIKFFYKNEFKNLFFKKIRSSDKKNIANISFPKVSQLKEKQIYSFLMSYVNHPNIRKDLNLILIKSDLLDKQKVDFLSFFDKPEYDNKTIENINKDDLPEHISSILEKASEKSIFELFPYSRNDYISSETSKEIQESVKNLNTRLSKLKKINKSLNEFDENLSTLSWEELKKITTDLYDENNEIKKL